MRDPNVSFFLPATSLFGSQLRRICSVFVLCLAVTPLVRALDVMPRSFSRSKQFVIYARDGAVRGGVGTLAEDTKSGLLNALNLRDEWRLPIVVDLRPPPPGLPDALPPVRLSLAQTGAGMKIELDLLTGDAGRGTRIRDELVRTLLLELAYRDVNGTAGQSQTAPPPWLVEGFSAYLENAEDGVTARMFAALLPTSEALPLQEFLAKNPAAMDSTSRGVYRAYSYNLVSLLLREMEGGRDGLLAFIHDLPKTPPAEALDGVALIRHFPALASSPDAMEKWWTLGLAHLADSDRFRSYTVEETEQHLQALLTFPGPVDPKKGETPKDYTLDDFKDFTLLKRNAAILEGTRVGLAELSGRANPLSQPIVLAYQEIVATLCRNRTAGIGEKLHALEEQRREVLKRREDIADYMNWYEATQVVTQSGEFEEYFRASHQLEARQRARRPDPISSYLDEMETEFR